MMPVKKERTQIMNKERRAEIQDVLKTLDNITAELEDLQSSIENIKDEEQDYLDNIPENLQESDRYHKSEEAIENLESACDTIEDTVENQMYEARTFLENAME